MEPIGPRVRLHLYDPGWVILDVQVSFTSLAGDRRLHRMVRYSRTCFLHALLHKYQHVPLYRAPRDAVLRQEVPPPRDEGARGAALERPTPSPRRFFRWFLPYV